MFIYFSGHGHRGSLRFYKKDKDTKGALKYSELYEMFRTEIVKQKDENLGNKNSIIKIQVVIDACHSGSAIDEFDPEKRKDLYELK